MTSFVLLVISSLALLVVYFKQKAQKAASDALLGEKRGEDRILERNQNEVKEEIEKVREQDDSNLTPEERASRWEK
jgi:hypothetical protein